MPIGKIILSEKKLVWNPKKLSRLKADSEKKLKYLKKLRNNKFITRTKTKIVLRFLWAVSLIDSPMSNPPEKFTKETNTMRNRNLQSHHK